MESEVRQYGISDARRLKALKDENGILRRRPADAIFNNAALNDELSQNGVAHRQLEAIALLRKHFQMNDRQACTILAVGCKTIRDSLPSHPNESF